MKTARIGLYTVLLAFTTNAAAQVHVERRGIDPSPRETLLPDTPVVVPMARDLGWAIVEAFIDGRGPYRFVFDTGAPGLFLCEDQAIAMNLPPPENSGGAHVEVRVAGPGGAGHPASLHQVRSLKLGDAEFRGLQALATKLPMPSDVAGVLGMGVLHDALVTLDYPAGEMRLERGELPPADGKQILDFTQPDQSHSHPTILVEVCGRSVDFIIDTGMTGWFRFTKELTQQCALLQGPVPGPPACSMDRKLPTEAARLAGAIRIGNCLFDRPHGMIDAMNLKPLIGGRALERFAVTLDQKNSRVRFAREGTDPIVPPAMRNLGFKPRRAQNGYQVWNLMAGSPAEKAGLKEGDLLIRVAGRKIEECYSGQAWDDAIEAPQVRVRFQPSDANEPREVDLPVMDLLPEVTAGIRPPRKDTT